MKRKIFLWVPIFMMAVVNMTFVSCSDDNNITPQKQNQKEDQKEPQNEVLTISPEYVPVKWEETEVYESNSVEGTYSFESTEETRRIEPGSVLAIDEGSTGEIVIVTGVEKDGDKVTITTEQGSLCDVFYDCEMTLSSDGTEAITRYAGGVVIAPEQVFMDGKDITSQVLTKASTSDYPITHNLWNWVGNYDNTVLFSSSNAKVYLEEANFSASLDVVIHLSFGNRNVVAATANAYRHYRSNALWVNASLKGSLATNLGIKADVSGSTTIKSNEDELWIHNVFKPINMKFVIQGVPVFVTLSADLFRGASLDLEGNMTYQTATHNKAEGSLGFEWQQSGTISPIRSMEMSNELVYPTVTGKGTITGKTWLYPRVHLSLYNLIGPSFDIKPYLGCSVKGGFREQLMSSSQDYCAWQLRCFAGLDVSAGLSLKFMNYETNHFDIGTIHITEKDLYKSPTRIEFLSSNGKVQRGVKNKVSFMVYDTNVMAAKETTTLLPQIVKFEAPGTLSSKYGIAKDGIVSVEWTPASNDDKMAAILYNAEGGVISKVEWGEAEKTEEKDLICPDENHPHAIDLGLPSGTKWCCFNVGASKPEGFGGYYAWGETREKQYYDLSNYMYVIDRPNARPYYTNIGLDIAGTNYDVAHVRMGSPWRMPSIDQQNELINNCSVLWTTLNGVNGILVTGPSGGKIFFPATGVAKSGALAEHGAYWSSSMAHPAFAYFLGFRKYYSTIPWFCENRGRAWGMSVRAVCK